MKAIKASTPPDTKKELFSEQIADSDVAALMLSVKHHRKLVETSGFAVSLEKSQTLLAQFYNGILRGWYGTRTQPKWCPQQSKFRGRGGQHQGVDIFKQKGTELVALADGRIEWNPQGAGGAWGNHIWLNFVRGGRNYTFVYAHLNQLVGAAPRNVRVGEVICRSGCTGNTVYCGQFNRCQRKEDHLHLELFSPSGRIDPVAFLGWSLQYADDSSCYIPNCSG